MVNSKNCCEKALPFQCQIGLFYIDEKYRNIGLGKAILDNVIKDMKENNITQVWAVTSKDHPFWHNVYNKGFRYYDKNLHPSVTGYGYKLTFMRLFHKN